MRWVKIEFSMLPLCIMDTNLVLFIWKISKEETDSKWNYSKCEWDWSVWWHVTCLKGGACCHLFFFSPLSSRNAKAGCGYVSCLSLQRGVYPMVHCTIAGYTMIPQWLSLIYTMLCPLHRQMQLPGYTLTSMTRDRETWRRESHVKICWWEHRHHTTVKVLLRHKLEVWTDGFCTNLFFFLFHFTSLSLGLFLFSFSFLNTPEGCTFSATLTVVIISQTRVSFLYTRSSIQNTLYPSIEP